MGDPPTGKPAAPPVPDGSAGDSVSSPAISRAAFLGTAAAAMFAALGVRWWLTPAEPISPAGGPPPPPAASAGSSSGPPLVTAEPLPPVAPPPRVVAEPPPVAPPVQPAPESDRAVGRVHRRAGRGTRTRRPRDKAATKPKPHTKPPAAETKPAPDPALAPPVRRKLGPELPVEPPPAPKEME